MYQISRGGNGHGRLPTTHLLKATQRVHRKYNVKMPVRLQGLPSRRGQDAEDSRYSAHVMEGEYEEDYADEQETSAPTSKQTETVEKDTAAKEGHWISTTYDEHCIPRRSEGSELLHRRRCTRCISLHSRRKVARHKRSMKPMDGIYCATIKDYRPKKSFPLRPVRRCRMRPQQSLKQWARAKQPAAAPEMREER
eukprot:4201355-Amphidinium_carterae.9